MALIWLRLVAALGALLVVAGVFFIYPPAALIVAGLVLVGTAYLIAEVVR